MVPFVGYSSLLSYAKQNCLKQINTESGTQPQRQERSQGARYTATEPETQQY